MDGNTEDLCKSFCCTCLCYERKLLQLTRVKDGINMLYWLLSYNSEVYKAGVCKDSMGMFICWECMALLHKITSFRDQVCRAQTQLTFAVEAQTMLKPPKCLSRLSYNYKNTYDITYTCNDDIDNFIDCGLPTGIKTELVYEDVASCTDYKKESEESECAQIKNDETVKIATDSRMDNEETESEQIKNGFRKIKMTLEEMMKTRELAKSSQSLIKTEFKCESCIICFKNKSRFDEHNKNRHVKAANCLICNSYIDEACLASHTMGHYTKYQCLYCNFDTQNCKDIVHHSTYRHKTEKSTIAADFTCKECGRGFDTYYKRSKHIHKMHQGSHECQKCGKTFPTKSTLVRHMRCHDTVPPRKECPTCMKMIRVHTWKQHMSTHAQRESFSCEACNKKFVCRASYENHMKFASVHAVQNYFTHQCKTCEKAYRTATELRDHVNYNHIGKTQHKCPICQKPFSTKRCITRHVNRAHNGIKENTRNKICQLCGKAFYTKKSLLEHELIHSGERPLTCEVCGSTFRQKASLYTHKKRVHNIHAKRKTVEAF